MNTLAGNQRMTSGQRHLLEQLLRRGEFDLRTVTLMHKVVGVPESFIGQPVVAWLNTLTSAEASRVIVKLENYVS